MGDVEEENMEVRKVEARVEGLPEEGRERVQEARGFSGILASKVRWYNRAFDTKQTCGGAHIAHGGQCSQASSVS